MTKQEGQGKQKICSPRTTIEEDKEGSWLSRQSEGPVATDNGEAVDLRESQGAVYKPSGPVYQKFIQYDRTALEELNDYLAQAVAAYEARMYRYLRPPTVPPDQPYKFLYAFEIKDAPIFFGRDAASEELHETVLQDWMTVLHAKSGAGKTSLLKAGLSPRLIREGRLPVYARAYEDPVLAVKRAIAPPAAGPWPELLPKLSLHEFLGLACKHLSRETEELVVVLDQFEEFFVFWPAPDHRQPFVETLASCYEDPSLPVRFIIGVRSDYYSPLATFKDCLSHIFHNDYYLDAMTRKEAQVAITGPVSKLDREVAYEPALLDCLLEDLAHGGIELPHLQIVCTRIYQAVRKKDGITISLASYEELGGMEIILNGYLNEVLDRLPPAERIVAREVLKELVSSEATKRVLSHDILQARLEVTAGKLEDVLARLVNERLLHRDEVQNGPVYEMSHEYLIGEIRTWIDQESLAFKQVQELLEREVASWRVHGTLIPKDRLEVLYTQRTQFGEISEEAWKCIIDSALHSNSTVEEWARIGGKQVVKPLIIALGNMERGVREAAACGLAQIGKPVVELVTIALNDEDNNVRETAANVLGRIGDTRSLEPLITALGDWSENVRQAAAHALGKLGDGRAAEPLTVLLGDNDWSMYEVAAEALERISDARAIESLIALLDNRDHNMRRTAAEALGKIHYRTLFKTVGS